MGSRVDAEQVCALLHGLFASFDFHCETLGAYKWATVGGKSNCWGQSSNYKVPNQHGYI